jgi:hypothetical protein
MFTFDSIIQNFKFILEFPVISNKFHNIGESNRQIISQVHK